MKKLYALLIPFLVQHSDSMESRNFMEPPQKEGEITRYVQVWDRMMTEDCMKGCGCEAAANFAMFKLFTYGTINNAVIRLTKHAQRAGQEPDRLGCIQARIDELQEYLKRCDNPSKQIVENCSRSQLFAHLMNVPNQDPVALAMENFFRRNNEVLN